MFRINTFKDSLVLQSGPILCEGAFKEYRILFYPKLLFVYIFLVHSYVNLFKEYYIITPFSIFADCLSGPSNSMRQGEETERMKEERKLLKQEFVFSLFL